MERRYEARHIFMAIGACIALFSPILLLIVPLLVVNTLYYKRGIWITYAPGENYMVFGISVFFLVLACAMLWYFDVQKWAIGISLGCVIVSCIVFYIASLSYVTLSDEEISYRTLLSNEKRTYAWEELEQLVYYVKLPEDDEMSHYEFYFKDGEMLTIRQNSLVTEIQGSLNSKVRGMGIPLKYVEPVS
ncbi:hypothetical protein [Psychrobacillus vulpis]|uniref:Uncharacterized protein n=1 Tax=Psychrobacillus vulpis TaxID=2325572 RepID=A0A544TS51_9BACI|nr:hypothetical protein [Psychrobacillus vulpis]TQR20283.1 hypothetical protein FG384_07515 [Psychrobacillus vulpis]